MRRVRGVRSILVAGLLVVMAGCEASRPAEAVAPEGDQAAKAEAPAEGAKGAVEADEGGSKADIYTLDAAAVEVAVGSKADGTITITPASGFKINEMYPWSVDFKGGENLTVSESLKKDAWALSKEKASVIFPVEAKAAGEEEVLASVKFSICNEEKCELFKKDVSIKVAAK